MRNFSLNPTTKVPYKKHVLSVKKAFVAFLPKKSRGAVVTHEKYFKNLKINKKSTKIKKNISNISQK